jgi:hypothetical protein
MTTSHGSPLSACRSGRRPPSRHRRRSVNDDSGPPASVAQPEEHRASTPGAEVRLLSGAPNCSNNGDVPTQGAYRLDELGWLQFQQLCTELLAHAGLPGDAWHGDADKLRTALAQGPLTSPLLSTNAPALLGVVWWRRGGHRHKLRKWAVEEADRQPVVVLSNVDDSALGLDGSGVEVIGPAEIGAALDSLPHVRRRVPFVLGVRDLEGLVDPEMAERSTADIPAAAALARVFVPTNAYRYTLGVLDRHGFVSTGGGAAGERYLPLLVDDADWDVLGDRLHQLGPALDDHDALRLLLALREAIRWCHATDRAELDAIALNVLVALRWGWDAARAPVPVTLLAEWVAVARLVPESVRLPDVTGTWIEALPTASACLRDRDDLRRLEDWLLLVELLLENDRAALDRFGFPDAQASALRNVARTGASLTLADADDDLREAVRITLAKLALTCPIVAKEAHAARRALRRVDKEQRDWWEPDLGPPRPFPMPMHAEGSLVTRILKDLRAA